MIRAKYIILYLLLLSNFLLGNISVQGMAKLFQQTDHSNIMIRFVPLSPSAIEDSTYTNYNGDWGLSIAVGRYTIVYSHDGYEDRVTEPTLFDTDTTLAEIILQPSLGTIYLSGNVSGTLLTGYTYIADSTITINYGDSLLIESGVKLMFGQLAGLHIYGYLEAIGTDLDYIRFTTISGAQARGSIIFWEGSDSTSILKYCVIEKGQGTTDAATNNWGGGLTLHYTNATIEHCIIRENYAQYGGGIYIEHCSPKLRYNTLSTNTAIEKGGGVYYNQYASGVFINNIVENNSVNQGSGGGLYIYYYSNPQIIGNTIISNQASAAGGGLYIDTSSPIVTNNNVIANIASSSGGGVFLRNSSSEILGNNIIGNISTSGGSGIDVYYGSSTYIINNIISNNTGGNAGVNVGSQSNPVFVNNIVKLNEGSFGGLTLSSSLATIEKNLFYNNRGTNVGSLYITGGGTPSINNNSFVFSNHLGSGSNVPAIKIWKDTSPVISSNIIAYGSVHFGIYLEPGGTGQPQIKYNNFFGFTNLVQNCPPGVGVFNANNGNGDPSDIFNNISMDPLFFNSDSGNFHLLANSPCINAGDPNLPLDPDSTITDMGAYPYNTQAGYEPFISVTIRQHHFTNIEVSQSDTFRLPIRNIGTANLTIQNLVSSDTHFVVLADSIVITPDSLIYVPIIFTPDSVGFFSGIVTINSNAINDPSITINLSGTGITTPEFWVATPLGYQARVGQLAIHVPVLISNVDGLEIVSYNVTIGYDSTLVVALPVSVVNTLSEGWSVATNIQDNKMIVGAAGTSALAGGGTLFDLVFDIKPGLPDSTIMYLPFEAVTFNDGSITPATATGYIQIENIVYGDVDDNSAVQAYDAALTLQYSVNLDPLPDLDPRPWVTWRIRRADVDGNHTIQAYDASLILQFVVGILDTFPVELGNGRSDIPESHFQIVQVGNELQFQINRYSSIFGCNLTIVYDTSAVHFSNVMQTALTNHYLMYTNDSSDGSLNIGLISAAPSDSSGSFIELPFNLNANTVVAVYETINNQDTLIHMVNLDFLGTLEPSALPTVNQLMGNYPNPFNPQTSIQYAVANKNSKTVLTIYDITGKRIRTFTQTQDPGYYSIVWDGQDNEGKRVSTGIYFYQLRIGNEFQKTERMLLIK